MAAGRPRIVLFANQFADQQAYGIARYCRELYRALADSGRHDVMPVSAWSPTADTANSGGFDGQRITLPWGRRLTPLLWSTLGTPPLERGLSADVDVVHALSLGYPVATRKPLIVTVHDLGPITHPAFFVRRKRPIMHLALRQLRRRAAAIVCVSRATAEEVMTVCGADLASRIHVVPEGVSPVFQSSADLTGPSLPLPAGTPFILSTAKHSPRKNLAGLVRSFASVASSIPHHLVLAGGHGWGDDNLLRELSDSTLAARVHLTGYVSDRELAAYYREASAYVHASLYEGFGLTVLEAMSAGSPVITSNRGALAEVAGDAAITIDPTDDDALAQSLLQLCSDNELQQQLVAKGRQRAAGYTWESTAVAMNTLYEAVSGASP